MPDTSSCPWGPEGHPRGTRHQHPYTPSGDIPRQCTCGSRQWHIAIGGGLPVTVACDRDSCHRTSRIATAYERGREDGVRHREAETDHPPF